LGGGENLYTQLAMGDRAQAELLWVAGQLRNLLGFDAGAEMAT